MSHKNARITNGIALIAVFGIGLMVSSCKKSTPEAPKAPPAPAKTETKAVKPAAPAEVNMAAPKPAAPKPAAQPDTNTAAEQKPAAAQPAAGTEPIPLVLPKPLFVGTPTNFQNIKNLEKPLGTARPPFYAPKGTSNVALHKPVTSSDEQPIIGEIKMITDGDKEAADGSYVELGPGVQNVTIDLGAEYNIYAITIWHYHKQGRVYRDVVVQVADDPDFIKNVQTVFNNDIDNACGFGVGQNMNYVETAEGKLIDAKGIKGRYVRCYSNGNNSNDMNNYIEVEVYGLPGK